MGANHTYTRTYSIISSLSTGGNYTVQLYTQRAPYGTAQMTEFDPSIGKHDDFLIVDRYMFLQVCWQGGGKGLWSGYSLLMLFLYLHRKQFLMLYHCGSVMTVNHFWWQKFHLTYRIRWGEREREKERERERERDCCTYYVVRRTILWTVSSHYKLLLLSNTLVDNLICICLRRLDNTSHCPYLIL